LLKEGDNNTKFFHNYACQCKQANTIWEVKNHRGEMVSSFDEVVVVGKDFYSDLFRAPLGCPIEEILNVVSLFPNTVSEESNVSL